MGLHHGHDDGILGEIEHSLGVVMGYVTNAVSRDTNDICRMDPRFQGCLNGWAHAFFVLRHIGGRVKRVVASMPAQVVAQHLFGLRSRRRVVNLLQDGYFIIHRLINRLAILDCILESSS